MPDTRDYKPTAALNLEEGPVHIQWPEPISVASLALMHDWLNGICSDIRREIDKAQGCPVSKTALEVVEEPRNWAETMVLKEREINRLYRAHAEKPQGESRR